MKRPDVSKKKQEIKRATLSARFFLLIARDGLDVMTEYMLIAGNDYQTRGVKGPMHNLGVAKAIDILEKPAAGRDLACRVQQWRIDNGQMHTCTADDLRTEIARCRTCFDQGTVVGGILGFDQGTVVGGILEEGKVVSVQQALTGTAFADGSKERGWLGPLELNRSRVLAHLSIDKSVVYKSIPNSIKTDIIRTSTHP